jgi:hypothetical protein
VTVVTQHDRDIGSTHVPNLPLYAVQEILDKAKGLVARFNISKGRRIIVEKPLLKTPNLPSLSLLDSAIATKLKTLSKIEQQQFLSLHNNFPEHSLSGIFQTNALSCGPDYIVGGV